MAIFEADIRGKTTSEDELTSRVFGALAIMDKRSVLLDFLLRLASGRGDQLLNLRNSLISLTNRDRDNLGVELWAHFGKRFYGEGYPDVYIEGVPSYLIVIEVKEDTKATSGQMVNQLNSVRRECSESEDEVAYFLLTKDEEKPRAAIEDAERRLKRYRTKIHWIKWTQVWEWLKEICEKPIMAETTDKRLLNDLIQLLEAKRMKDATEIRCDWFVREVAESVDKLNRLYEEMCLFVLKLRKALGGLELAESGGDNGEAAFEFYPENMYTYRKPLHDKGKRLVPSSIDMCYRDEKWRSPSLNEACIFISADISERTFSVGFWNQNIPEEDCSRLERAARRRDLNPDRGLIGKGRRYIDIRDHLIQGSSNNGELKDVTFEALKSSLKQMRDFVRKNYGIEQTPRMSVRSKRRR